MAFHSADQCAEYSLSSLKSGHGILHQSGSEAAIFLLVKLNWAKQKQQQTGLPPKATKGLYLDLFSRYHHSLMRACVCFVCHHGPVEKWHSLDVGQNKSDDPAPPKQQQRDGNATPLCLVFRQ